MLCLWMKNNLEKSFVISKVVVSSIQQNKTVMNYYTFITDTCTDAIELEGNQAAQDMTFSLSVFLGKYVKCYDRFGNLVCAAESGEFTYVDESIEGVFAFSY